MNTYLVHPCPPLRACKDVSCEWAAPKASCHRLQPAPCLEASAISVPKVLQLSAVHNLLGLLVHLDLKVGVALAVWAGARDGSCLDLFHASLEKSLQLRLDPSGVPSSHL